MLCISYFSPHTITTLTHTHTYMKLIFLKKSFFLRKEKEKIFPIVIKLLSSYNKKDQFFLYDEIMMYRLI